MRATFIFLFLVVVSCGGVGKESKSASSDKTADEAGSAKSAPGKYCTKYDICYDDVSRADYGSDEELMCAQYCTYYCACYEKIEGEECYEGGGCTLGCESGMSKEGERADWLRRIRCAQEAPCKRFMDEC